MKSAPGMNMPHTIFFFVLKDLGDFGIAPRKIVTTGKFTNEETRRKRPALVVGPSVIPGESPLQDLIVPSK